MPTTAEDLRDWFRALKDASGLSYAQIGAAIGEEERNVKRWMTVSGEPVIPRGDVVLRLLSTLGVTFNPPAPGSVRGMNAVIGELRDLFAGAGDLIEQATEADEDASVRALAQDRQILRELATRVDAMSQATADSLGSGQLPASEPTCSLPSSGDRILRRLHLLKETVAWLV